MPSPTSILASTTAAQDSVPATADGLVASVGSDAVLLICFALAVIALVAVCNVISTRRAAREAARDARKRSDALRELLRSLRMAESIAGIGVWEYDYATETQRWSDGLKRIFGIDREDELCAGDAETVLFVNDIDLIGKIRQRAGDVEPFTFRFDLSGFDGVMRLIEVQACNLRSREGEVQRVVAVVRDVTQEMDEEYLQQSCESHDDTPAAAPLPKLCAKPREPVLSDIDGLTGLANRRLLMRQLDKTVLDARLSLKPLVLVMFDIDHLSRINDAHGRNEGDLVLKKVAAIAQDLAREADFIGRIGGEEFAWIIPQATDGMARVMTERLRQRIASDSGVGRIAPVTISLGFASIHSGDTALSLFARADAALFDAKDAGRNRVRVAA